MILCLIDLMKDNNDKSCGNFAGWMVMINRGKLCCIMKAIFNVFLARAVWYWDLTLNILQRKYCDIAIYHGDCFIRVADCSIRVF